MKKKMPQLQDETYASFLERNNHIAVHKVKRFADVDGNPVRVSNKKEGGHSLGRYSRAGFNRDKTQVLLFNGQVFYLYEKKGNQMRETGRCVMWIS